MNETQTPCPPLRHKTPCKECPWRLASAGGWLGGHPSDYYTDSIRADNPISCHMTLEEGRREALCAGSLVHYRNKLQKPRRLDLNAAVESVEPSPLVFRLTQDFTTHHAPIANAIAAQMGHMEFHSNPEFHPLVKTAFPMKHNLFGERILQPGDDIYVAFVDKYDTDSDSALTAFDIDDDPVMGWSCLIEDEDCNSIQAHDFPSKEALISWLTSQDVAVIE